MFFPKPEAKRRKPRGRASDPVTPEVAEMVMERDLRQVWMTFGGEVPFARWRMTNWNPCVAPVLDPAQSGRCWGRTTLDHIHDEMGVGKPRAKSDPAHLVSLCQGHTEDGRTGGYQFNTAHRDDIREYLRRFVNEA